MSFLIPLIPIDLGINLIHGVEQKAISIDDEPITVNSSQEMVTSTPIESRPDINIDYLNVLGITFLSISLLLLIRFIYRFGSIIFIQISGNRLENNEGFNLIFTDKTDNAFSFLGYIFINPLKFNDEEKRLIIEHEREHVRHFHSLDLILIELLIILQWFNPFAYVARRKLIEIHEFIADNGVIRKGADPHSYQNLLLSVVTSSCLPTAGNQLSAVITKKRIAMIGKPMNQTGRWINFLILVPTAVILIIGISAFSPKEPIMRIGKKSIEQPYTISNLSELEKRAEKVMNGSNFLKDFYYNIPSKETNTNLSPEKYNNNTSVILKKDCEYNFFYFSGSKDDKLVARIESDKSEVNVTETDFYFSFSGKRSFTPKQTGAYHLSMVNLTSRNAEVLMVMTLKENKENVALGQQDNLSSKEELLALANKNGITNALTNVYFELKPNEYQEKSTISLDEGNDYIFNFLAKSKGERIDVYINNADKEKPLEAAAIFSGSTEVTVHVKKTSKFSIRAGNRSSNNKVELLSLIRLKGKHDPKNDTIGKYSPNNPGEEETFIVVEEMPTFGSGKDDEFRNWVVANLKYPKEAADKGIKGRVFVQFIVSKDGSLNKAKVIRGVHPLLDAEALRLINSSPKWNPGKQRGVAVDVSYTFPITFGDGEEARTIQAQGLKTSNPAQEISNSDEKVLYLMDEKVEEEEVFLVVEQMPSFGSGDANDFRSWVAANMKYPKEAIEKEIQGRVFVQFIIEKDGTVSNVKIIRSADPILDKEAIRIVQSSPKWNPGKQKGKVVRVSYTFPITFTL